MNRRKDYRDMAKFRETCRKQQSRYYSKTAFIYGKRIWTTAADAIGMEHNVTDITLSQMIQRSVAAIQQRRSRLKKEAEVADDVG